MAKSTTAAQHGRRTRPVVIRFLARRLWSSTQARTVAEVVAFQKRSYDKAVVIVRVYYAISVLWMLGALQRWPDYQLLESADPLWPTRWWFQHVTVRTGVNLIFCAYLGASILAMLLPQLRLARAAYAITLLEYLSFESTHDKINADMLMWLFVSMFLVFLPRGPWSEQRRGADRQYFLTVIWGAILAVGLFYSLSGYWKVHDAFFAFIRGRNSGFDISGFSLIVGQRLTRSSAPTVFGVWFTRHQLLGWALFLGTMYVETASLVIAFRPRLHRLWGAALIFFHIGTLLVMGFTFLQNVALLGLLFVCSPFAPDRVDIVGVKDAFLDLPIVHFAARRIRSVRHRSARAALGDGPTGEVAIRHLFAGT